MNKDNVIINVECKPESVAKAVIDFEHEAGENYLEYGDFFPDASVIMKFALANKFITEEKFKTWEEGFEDNEMGSEETFEVILGIDPEEDLYAITYEDENRDFEEVYYEAMLVYGKLICSDKSYYKKFVETLKEKTSKYPILVKTLEN